MEIEIIISLIGVAVMASIPLYILINLSKEEADNKWLKR